jgi:hypothetical protein
MTELAPAPTPLDTTTVPAVSDLLQPQSMTAEVAAVKRVEYLGDPKFRERVLAGDAEANKQWKDVHRALSPSADPATAEGREYNQRMNGLAILRAKAELPEIMWDHVAANGPVSLAEREEAQFAKQRLFSDTAWKERYLSGDIAANSELTRIHFVLASPIGTFEEIEAFKAAAAKRLNGGGKK